MSNTVQQTIKLVAMMILMRIVVQNFLYVSQPVTGLVSSKCL